MKKNKLDKLNLKDETAETDSGMYLNLLADEPGEAEAAMDLNALVDDPEKLKAEATELIDAVARANEVKQEIPERRA